MQVVLILAALVPSSIAVIPEACIQLPAALTQFAADIGVPKGLDYTLATVLQEYVDEKIQAATSTKDLVQLCTARQTFYNTMGRNYENCINRYNVYRMGGSTVSNARVLEHLFRQLQFMCSSGFNIWVANRDCVNLAQRVSQCADKYDITIFENDPVTFCGSNAQDYLNCVQTDYRDNCENDMAGWFGCERERVGWAKDCVTLTCSVSH